MLKKILVVLVMLLTFSMHFNVISAEESGISSGTQKKYTLSICAIFKNEAKNLKDWIEHHRGVGVDHFYLYNTGSRDRFMPVLIPYMNEGLVTLVNWPSPTRYNNMDDYLYALSIQVPAYENAVNFVAREETKWLILMDIDQRLICPKGNLAKILMDYDGVPSIDLSGDTYDAAIKTLGPFKKIYAEMQKPANSDIQTVDQSSAKLIFKPDLCQGFIWPPYQCRFSIQDPGIQADPQELRIQHYFTKNRNFSSEYNFSARLAAAYDSDPNDFIGDMQEKNSNISMYTTMPEFLKKLKLKQQNEGLPIK